MSNNENIEGQFVGAPSASLATATNIVDQCAHAGLVPFIKGSPGLGKSAIVHAFANKHNLELIDLRLSQCDPTDLQGFPSTEGGRSTYAPPSYIPLASDEKPANKAGWLLFLDEFNSADRSVQRAAYKLVLDRMVGQHHIHKNVVMVCAGNLDDDNAITEELSSALQSRLVHLKTHVDLDEWLEWARHSNVDTRVTSFLSFKPELLHKFDPDSPDVTYPCPRTWEFVHKYMKSKTGLTDADRIALGGMIGQGAATEFDAFLDVHQSLPKLKDILANPETVKVPDEPSVLYALTGALGAGANDKNLTDMVKFIARMPIEFTITTFREICSRNKDLAQHQAITAWKLNNTHILG